MHRGADHRSAAAAWSHGTRHGSATSITAVDASPTTRASFVQFEDVSKTYRGLLRSVPAVVDVSFDIRRGEIVGLAGPNGAGKSTLIALLLGFLKPTAGTVRIDGHGPRDFVERRGVGYLSELVVIPPRWRLEEALARYALLAGIHASKVRARVAAVVEQLGLAEHWGKQIRQLSKGNLQRVGLAQALLHDEELLILDEPTHGLDPVWTQRFREIVTELRNDARSIFIASHNLDELQRIADRVAIIDHGRLQRVVSTRAVGGPTGAVPYRLIIARGWERAKALLPLAQEGAPNELELPALPVEAMNEALQTLMTAGVLVASVAPVYSSLERQFREAIGDAGDGASHG